MLNIIKNPSVLSRVIAKNVGDVFLRHSVEKFTCRRKTAILRAEPPPPGVLKGNVGCSSWAHGKARSFPLWHIALARYQIPERYWFYATRPFRVAFRQKEVGSQVRHENLPVRQTSY